MINGREALIVARGYQRIVADRTHRWVRRVPLHRFNVAGLITYRNSLTRDLRTAVIQQVGYENRIAAFGLLRAIINTWLPLYEIPDDRPDDDVPHVFTQNIIRGVLRNRWLTINGDNTDGIPRGRRPLTQARRESFRALLLQLDLIPNPLANDPADQEQGQLVVFPPAPIATRRPPPPLVGMMDVEPPQDVDDDAIF